MATANAQNVSATGQGDGGFFSRITDFLGGASQVTRDVGTLWNNVSPTWSDQPPQSGAANSPTFQNPPSQVESTASVTANPAANYMPIILIGGGILAVLFLLK